MAQSPVANSPARDGIDPVARPRRKHNPAATDEEEEETLRAVNDYAIRRDAQFHNLGGLQVSQGWEQPHLDLSDAELRELAEAHPDDPASPDVLSRLDRAAAYDA